MINTDFKAKMERIKELSKYIKLSYSYNNAESFLEEQLNLNTTIVDFYLELLEKEAELRNENGKENRIRAASFPYKKYLSDIKTECLPSDAREKFSMLQTLEFIKNGQNLILAGNPGTGKTHIAIGIGLKACIEGFKVLFCTVPTLINKLKEAKSSRTLLSIGRQFENYDLVILDELGYISFDKEGGELLFTHLSLRSERKSTIITTNLSFERWEDIFKDPVMTTAIIDRITHKSFVVNMNGNSYRLKETQDMFKFVNRS